MVGICIYYAGSLGDIFTIWQAKLQSFTREKEAAENSSLRSEISNLTKTVIEKERAATEANAKYLKINEELLSLNYALSVDLIYDPGVHQLKIFNRGKTNIFLWGTKVNAGVKTIERQPRVITPTPDSFYYLKMEEMEKDILAKLGPNGESRVPFEAYFENAKSQRYIAKFLWWVVVADNKITIHTQNVGIDRADWAKS